MSRRLTDKIAAWIEDALDLHDQGDRVEFDVTFLPGQGGPVLFVAFYIPGVVIGDYIHAAASTGDPIAIDAPQVNRLVQDMLEALRAERSKQAAAPVGDSNRPSLLVPGR